MPDDEASPPPSPDPSTDDADPSAEEETDTPSEDETDARSDLPGPLGTAVGALWTLLGSSDGPNGSGAEEK